MPAQLQRRPMPIPLQLCIAPPLVCRWAVWGDRLCVPSPPALELLALELLALALLLDWEWEPQAWVHGLRRALVLVPIWVDQLTVAVCVKE